MHFRKEKIMTTLQLARHEVEARAKGQAQAHPLRFAVGVTITVAGAALFLAQVAWLLAAAI